MYHGLTEDKSCDDWTQIHPDEFKKQMLYIKENYDVISISDMLDIFKNKKTRLHLAVVTFDDGYRSVYETAFPILRELGIPATVYITSNFIGNDRKDVRFIWPDYVRVLLVSSRLSTIDLSHFKLGNLDISDPLRQRISVNRIIEHLKLIGSSEKNNIISYLEEKSPGMIDHDLFPAYHPMTWEEVKRLSTSDLISIGAHTRNHPILSRIKIDELEGEISGSKQDIENRIETDVHDFAYPNGRMIDINDEAIEIAKRGFRSAVTTFDGHNRPDRNPYLLGRVGVGRNLAVDNFKLVLAGISQ
ncbi:MAG: polysaccharide deacetylase family protein [Candidatus Zixiibacteriota bacterium]|nr:MAG: polysaccharide deacetylase family protein [candidate division Zixibacteria bacterium]